MQLDLSHWEMLLRGAVAGLLLFRLTALEPFRHLPILPTPAARSLWRICCGKRRASICTKTTLVLMCPRTSCTPLATKPVLPRWFHPARSLVRTGLIRMAITYCCRASFETLLGAPWPTCSNLRKMSFWAAGNAPRTVRFRCDRHADGFVASFGIRPGLGALGVALFG